jgi:hypothetical protein
MAGRISYYGNIVRDGLVLNLDAAKRDSYPGVGTAWNDISGFQNNGTLNGPTFNGANGGSIVFDGVDDYGRINSFNRDNLDPLSVFCWIYPTNLSNNSFDGNFLNWIINKRPSNSGPNQAWQFSARNSKLSVSIADSSGNFISVYDPASGIYTLQLNQWQYVGFVTDGVTGGFINTYYNGNLNLQGSLTGNRNKTSLNIDIGKAGWVDLFHWTGRISNVSIYNRALSAAEVLQNYNATKNRYI